MTFNDHDDDDRSRPLGAPLGDTGRPSTLDLCGNPYHTATLLAQIGAKTMQ
jgi:hypothetical protein